MIAANKRGGRRSRRAGRGAARGPRHGHGTSVNVSGKYGSYALLAGVGGGDINTGLRTNPRQFWDTSVPQAALAGDTGLAVYRIRESIPFLGKIPARTGNRMAVGVFLLGKYGHKLPVLRQIGQALHIKVGRKTYRAW
jgi:hypothetical protein